MFFRGCVGAESKGGTGRWLPTTPMDATTINGRLDHLPGTALELGDQDHYILRSLIHSGQLQNKLNAL